VNDAIVMKRLYMRCPIPDYTLNKSDYSYIFVLPDGNISCISECSLCSITVGGSGIWTQKVGLYEERTRIVEEHEWNDFVEYWNLEIMEMLASC
jgi:hypothetical protein